VGLQAWGYRRGVTGVGLAGLRWLRIGGAGIGFKEVWEMFSSSDKHKSIQNAESIQPTLSRTSHEPHCGVSLTTEDDDLDLLVL
jgi:hypothetical protein